MFPNWLLPPFDPASVRKIGEREHIIWKDNPGDVDQRNRRGKGKGTEAQREEMRRMEKCGWSRAEIARHFGLCNSSVSKALGSKGVAIKGRDRRPMEIDGQFYRTQTEVFTAFKVRTQGLRKLIESGRAKYV